MPNLSLNQVRSTTSSRAVITTALHAVSSSGPPQVSVLYVSLSQPSPYRMTDTCRPSQHIEFAEMHGGDPEDDDSEYIDIGFDDSYEGWEDDVGAVYFPEENDDYYELPVHQDDVTPEEDEYWDADDEPAPEEDDETDYNGWAPVPPAFAPVVEADTPEVSILIRSEGVLWTPLLTCTPSLLPLPPLLPPVIAHPATMKVPSAAPSRSSSASGASTPRNCTDGCKATGHPPAVTRTTSNGGPALVGCPLCLEEVDRPCVTQCGHVFCAP